MKIIELSNHVGLYGNSKIYQRMQSLVLYIMLSKLGEHQGQTYVIKQENNFGGISVLWELRLDFDNLTNTLSPKRLHL